MKQSLWILAFLACSLGLPFSTALQIDDEQPIDIELRAADLGDTLQSFADISGRELVLDPAVAGKVTIDLKKVPWQEALGEICTQHALSCQLLQGDPPLLRVVPASNAGGPPLDPGKAELLDMSLEKADLRQTVTAFGAVSGRKVVVDDTVSGSITLDVEDVPWQILLEEVCALDQCRIEWGEGVIRVLPAGEGAVATRRADLDLRKASLEEAFATVAGLQIFGYFGTPVVIFEDELAARVDVDLENASWSEMLRSICAAAGCDAILRYSVPSRIEIRARNTRLDDDVDLDGREVRLDEAAAELARHAGLAARLDDDLDPATRVRLPDGPLPWRRAMLHVCRQVACSWQVGEEDLVLALRVTPLARHPPAGIEGVAVRARLAADGASTLDATARFTWAEPIFTLGGDSFPGEVRLSWIPFGPDLHFILPIVARCRGGEIRELDVLDPARLPFPAAWSRATVVGTLELETPGASGRTEGASGWISPCLERSAGRFEATFYRSGEAPDGGGAAGRRHLRTNLFNRVGAYLLVTAPGGGPAPLAAVVVLDPHPEGQRLAIVRPADGRGEIELLSLTGEGAVRRELIAPGGTAFVLELRMLEG